MFERRFFFLRELGVPHPFYLFYLILHAPVGLGESYITLCNANLYMTCLICLLPMHFLSNFALQVVLYIHLLDSEFGTSRALDVVAPSRVAFGSHEARGRSRGTPCSLTQSK